VLRALSRGGGALLAEAVGRGKTYVALAAARDAPRLLIVAPAVLLPMWRDAAQATAQRADFVSMERLSRGAGARHDTDFVIVDEAHHFRSPGTRRFAALRELCVRARVLLLTATPIHNHHRDVSAILSLFLGEGARARDPRELAEHIVRSHPDGDAAAGRPAEGPSPPLLPRAGEPEWVDLPPDERSLDLLLCLPPPVPVSDGAEAGVLLTYTLLRQWSSSRAALRAALQRRLFRAAALTDALDQGRHPTRREIAAWTAGDGAVQLCMADLLVEAGAGDAEARSRMREALGEHAGGVRALLDAMCGGPDPDAHRAAAIRDILSRHPGERVVAFATFSETVFALYSALAPTVRCCALAGRGARVAGGSISRREALRRFAPRAHGSDEPRQVERIDLLICTDLLSEGCNLQDASVVVHLDLPWTPARLEQRVGRVRRLGSAHRSVAVYMLRPPAASERLLDVEERLRRKLATAMRGVGVSGTILPGIAHLSPPERPSAAEALSRLVEWARDVAAESSAAPPGRSAVIAASPERSPVIVAAAESTVSGILALVESGDGARLLGARDGAPLTSDHGVVAELLLAANHTPARVPKEVLARGVMAAELEARRCRAAAITGVADARLARARRRLLHRLATTGRRLPSWKRAELMPLLVAGRRVATQLLPAGAERVLDELAVAPLPEEQWLRAVAAFTDAHARSLSASNGAVRLVAVLVMRCPGESG
jgi:hypothetical protein